jgi:hypothetical protein
MKNKFSLLQYSISAAAVLNSVAAYSQVVYTDIDPDVVLDEPDEMFGIDLDDDGLNDFNFFNESFTTTVFYMDIANVKALFVGAFDTMQNGIVGSTGFLSGGGGYTYYRPYALEAGEMVGNSDNFYKDNYQTMAKEIDKFDSPFSNTHLGNWYSFYGVEISNKYLGFRFTNEEFVQRYGWIRCSVIDSGRTLIIHDYAYELQPDYPILAGDTLSYVNINEQENTVEASVYSFNKYIYINLNKNRDAQLIISDLTGKEILKKELVTDYTTIDMSLFSTGIYLVNLIQQEKAYSKKILIE